MRVFVCACISVCLPKSDVQMYTYIRTYVYIIN